MTLRVCLADLQKALTADNDNLTLLGAIADFYLEQGDESRARAYRWIQRNQRRPARLRKVGSTSIYRWFSIYDCVADNAEYETHLWWLPYHLFDQLEISNSYELSQWEEQYYRLGTREEVDEALATVLITIYQQHGREASDLKCYAQ